MTDIDEHPLQTAFRRHRVGDIAGARDLYREWLCVDPAQADALHMLGVVENRLGRPLAGLDLVERALRIDSALPGGPLNRGVVAEALLGEAVRHHAAGRAVEAATLYRRIAESAPEGGGVQATARANLSTVLDMLLAAAADAEAPEVRRIFAAVLRSAPDDRGAVAERLNRIAGARYGQEGGWQAAREGFTALWEATGEPRYFCRRLMAHILNAGWAGMEDEIARFVTLSRKAESVTQLRDAAVLLCNLIEFVHTDRRFLVGALGVARRLLRHDPKNDNALHILFFTLYLFGHYDILGRWLERMRPAFTAEELESRPYLRYWHGVRLAAPYLDSLADEPEHAALMPATQVAWVAPVDRPACVTLISFDHLYFRRYARRLIGSILEHNCNYRHVVHVHVMNPDDHCLAALRTLRDRGAPVSVSYEVIPSDSPLRRTQGLLHTYYATSRFYRVRGLQALYRAPVLMIDADAVCRRGYVGFVSDLAARADHDVFFCDGGRTAPFREIIAQWILVSDTEGAHRYLELLARYVAAQFAGGRAYWTLDQSALFCCAVHRQRRTGRAVGAPIDAVEVNSYVRFAKEFEAFAGHEDLW